MVDIITVFISPFILGLFVLLSPCGYALIPGYIAYNLGSDITVSRALKGAVTATLGLISIFSLIGIAVTFVGWLVKPYITLVTILAAVIMIVFGLSILLGVTFPMTGYSFGNSNRKGLLGFYFYGIAYGLAASGCTAPIFFSTVFLAITKAGTIGGFLFFISYALGVGLPLIVTSFLVATAKTSIISRINTLTPKLYKLSGVIMILMGIYLIYIYYNSGLLSLL